MKIFRGNLIPGDLGPYDLPGILKLSSPDLHKQRTGAQTVVVTFCWMLKEGFLKKIMRSPREIQDPYVAIKK